MKELAKALRSHMTEAEHLLWYHLRGRRLGGYKFRRQVVIEPYIVDFVCLEAKLIIEADGGQHVAQVEEDEFRTRNLKARGYQVLRFWNDEILKDTESVLEHIHQNLIEPPHPNPSP